MRVPKKQRGVIEVGINPHRLTYCTGRLNVLLGPSWLAFEAFYQLIVLQVVAALAKLFLAALKRMSSLHKVSSLVHTFSTVKLSKGVQDLNKAEIELAF